MPDTDTGQDEVTSATAPEAATEPEAEPVEAEPKDDDLPEWAKKKLRRVNDEAKSLRARLKEQEPLVAAAQEAERAKMSEAERYKADAETLRAELAQRDTQLLQARYQIPDDYAEFITGTTFEEKEARAVKVGQMVQQPKSEPDQRPPSERPIESLKPGASPSPPPVEDHSYPAQWGFLPATGT